MSPQRLLDSHDVLSMRTSAKWNDASKYGLYDELFFFLMKKEPTKHFGESVGTPFQLHEFMRVVEQGSVPGNLRDYGLAHDSDLDRTPVLANSGCLN